MGKALLQQVHLGEEDELTTYVTHRCRINLTVKVAQLLPQGRATSLAKLAVEDYNGPLQHYLSHLLNVVQKVALQGISTVQVDSTTDMPSKVLFLRATVNNDNWVWLLLR